MMHHCQVLDGSMQSINVPKLHGWDTAVPPVQKQVRRQINNYLSRDKLSLASDKTYVLWLVLSNKLQPPVAITIPTSVVHSWC